MSLSILDLFSGWGVSFMLVLTRVSAMIYAFPFFGSPAIAIRIRILITLVISFMLLPLVGVEGLGLDWSLGRVAFAVSRELAIGLFVGFGTKFMFEAFSLAGTFAGRQMGFAIAELVDPVTSAPQSMVGQFWALVAILLFVAVDGHHFLIRLLVQNFRLIPLDTGALQAASGQMLISGSSEMFQLALKLAAPALVLTLMMDVGVGVLSRAMPRFHVFFVALPLKLTVGVFALIVSLQLFQALFSAMYMEFRNI
ncbi:MAG: flagellar biosynthetic protein FliR [Fidelibacterota bacterium]|nr:MAG: flagellar biosynthetic protein FliR [Candidatus Neomarinimicrobiota bacterium]